MGYNVAMFRFIRLTLVLILTLAAAILVARLVGGTQPLPSAALWDAIFTNPDGSPCQKPCMFGVIPGITGLEDSNSIIHQHPYTQNFEWMPKSDVTQRVIGNDVILEMGGEKNSFVDSIQLTIKDSTKITVGEFIAYWGIPDDVGVLSYDSGYQDELLRYNKTGYTVDIVKFYTDSIHPDNEIGTVLFFVTAYDENLWRWHGFGNFRASNQN